MSAPAAATSGLTDSLPVMPDIFTISGVRIYPVNFALRVNSALDVRKALVTQRFLYACYRIFTLYGIYTLMAAAQWAHWVNGTVESGRGQAIDFPNEGVTSPYPSRRAGWGGVTRAGSFSVGRRAGGCSLARAASGAFGAASGAAVGVRGTAGRQRDRRTATAEKPVAHQNASPNPVTRFPWCAVTALDRITARTAVPNEPPICCAVLVTTLEWAICSLPRPRNATVITEMVTAPRPRPRITSHSASSHAFVCDPAKPKGMVAAATMTKPTTAIGRAPILSVSRPARPRESSVPTPCGTSMSPAVSAEAPRTSW